MSGLPIKTNMSLWLFPVTMTIVVALASQDPLNEALLDVYLELNWIVGAITGDCNQPGDILAYPVKLDRVIFS